MSAQPLPPMLLDSLRAVVPAESVRPPGASDAIDGVLPECIVEPSSEAELARVLAYANAQHLQVAPRGHGTKSDWGNAAAEVDLALSTVKLNRVLEHAHQDMTATVEAGTTFNDLQTTLAKHGQNVALDPLWPEQATVGGVIATNDSGSLRLRYGSVRDLIIGITVVLPDGTIANSGGKVVKNVAGYDLPKLMTGAHGTLGLITKAVFRLHPLPEQSRTVSVTFSTAEAANNFMLAIADSVLVPTGVQLRILEGKQPEVDVRFGGISQSVNGQMESMRKLLGEASMREQEDRVWRSREDLWQGAHDHLICKLSMLPTQISEIAEFVRRTHSVKSQWSFVAQSTGIALLRTECLETSESAGFIRLLRAKLVSAGGSLVLLHCSRELKREVDAWGEPGSAHALMKRIKERFDPNAILNRGRFVGGI